MRHVAAGALCVSLTIAGNACVSARATSTATPLEAASIIERHVDALGGRAKLGAIQSLQIIAILDERGTLHPMFVDRRRPNYLRVRMIHGGELVFSEVYTGSSSWEGAPGKESCRPDSAATEATRHAAEHFDDALLSAAAHAAMMRYVGIEQIGGRRLHRIDVTQRDSSRGSYYVDAETFMLNRIRNRRPLHPTEPVRLIEEVLDDYRPVSGVLMPFRGVERDVATGEPLTSSITLWMEANVPIAGNPYEPAVTCK